MAVLLQLRIHVRVHSSAVNAAEAAVCVAVASICVTAVGCSTGSSHSSATSAPRVSSSPIVHPSSAAATPSPAVDTVSCKAVKVGSDSWKAAAVAQRDVVNVFRASGQVYESTQLSEQCNKSGARQKLGCPSFNGWPDGVGRSVSALVFGANGITEVDSAQVVTDANGTTALAEIRYSIKPDKASHVATALADCSFEGYRKSVTTSPDGSSVVLVLAREGVWPQAAADRLIVELSSRAVSG